MKTRAFEKNLIDAAKTYGISFLDVGARGGVAEDLLPLSAAVDAVCFEPEPIEAKKLESEMQGNWASLTVLPTALGGSVGPANLYIPKSEQSASLFRHNEDMVSRFGHESMHKIDRTLEVTCKTIDSLYAEGVISKATYMKLDIEGVELDLLKSAQSILQTTVAMRLEVSFLEQRINQPLIWEIVDWLASKDFEVIDIIDIHRWRRRNIPGAPYRGRYQMPFSKARVAQCDLLLLRKFDEESPLEYQVQAVLTMAAMGYFDSSIQLMRDNPEIEKFWHESHGFSLERSLENESAKTGKIESWSYLSSQLRALVPAIRSAMFGLPATEENMPY